MKKHLLLFTSLLIAASIYADPLEDDLLNDFENSNTTEEQQNNVDSTYTSEEIALNIDHDEWDYYANEFYPEGIIEDEEPLYAITDNRVFNPHRFFEFGYKMEVGVSNNYFTPGMILVKDLVIDLNKIATEMPYNGLQLNMLVTPGTFWNLNLRNGFHLGFSNGIEVNSCIGVGKGLFEFLGHGNAASSDIVIDMTAYAEAFMHLNLAVGLDAFNGYHLEVQPSLFLPIGHITSEGSYASLSNTDDGKISFKTVANASAYTITDFQTIFQSGDTSQILNDLGSGWGFDLTTSIDKKIFDFLTVQAYSRIPLLPGRLKYKTNITTSVEGEFEGVQSLIDSFTNSSSSSSSESGSSESSSGNSFSDMVKYTEPVISTEASDYSISRPFRIGAQASFQPYGRWLTFSGLFGMGCRQPFSSSAQGYVEYDLSVNVGLPIPLFGEVVGVEFTHGYLSQTFRNQLMFIFSARAVELNLGVSTQSSNFATSFALSGANVFLYLAFGW